MWLVAFAAVSYFGGSGAVVVPIAVGFSLLTTWWSYYSSDKLVIRMTGAQVLQESDNPKLFGLVQEVCLASGLPMPKVAVVVDDAPNAFATGRNPEHALIAALVVFIVSIVIVATLDLSFKPDEQDPNKPRLR